MPEYKHSVLSKWISTLRRSDEKKEVFIMYRNLKLGKRRNFRDSIVRVVFFLSFISRKLCKI